MTAATLPLRLDEGLVPAVELRRMEKCYGRQVALKDISLRFDPGSVTALLGHNGAGKSTLVKILSGIVKPDAGTIVLGGETTIAGGFDSPAHARQEGVVAVQQDLNLIGELSLLENWALADHFAEKRVLTVSWRREVRQAVRGLQRLGVEDRLRPLLRRKVSEFTLRQRAWANLAIALLAKRSERRPRIVILDEITSAIDATEARELVAVARRFVQNDVALVIVTHDVEEALAVSDRVVILRDGQIAGDQSSVSLATSEVVGAIVGINAGPTGAHGDRIWRGSAGVPVLRLHHLRTEGGSAASVEVRSGEILGITGLPDSGAFDLPLLLATGQLRDATGVTARRIGYIPGDRSIGLIPEASVRDNVTIASLSKIRFTLGGRAVPYLSPARARLVTEGVVRDLKIRLPSVDAAITQLSGGNQQKVILARWLLADVEILVLEEPLQGLDIGAKGDFVDRIRAFAADGGAVVYVASDAEELATCCQHVVVMRRGRVGAIVGCGDVREAAATIAKKCYV